MEGLLAAIRVVGATALVVAGAAWAARAFGRQAAAGAKGRHLSILDSVSLGPQKGLYVVQAGARFLVLSSSREGLKLLSESSEAEFFAASQATGTVVPAPTYAAPSSPDLRVLQPNTANRSALDRDPLMGMVKSRIDGLRRRLAASHKWSG